jgi:tetratricopeptide (TPR) repeat protein
MRPSPFRLAIALIAFITGVVIFEVKHPTLVIIRQNSPHRIQFQSATPLCENETVRALKEEAEIDPGSAELRSDLADAYTDLGCYEEAIGAYQEALALNPSDTYSLSNLGNTYDQLGRYEEAAEVLQKNIRLDSKDTYAYGELSYVYNALDRYQDSLNAARRNLQLDADNAFAHAEMADAYFHLKRYDEAAAEASKAFALSQTEDDNVAALNAGLVMIKLKRYEEATLAIQQAIKLSPNYINAYSALAEIQNILGHRQEALSIYRRVLARKPEVPDEYLLRGWAYLHLGYGSAAALEARNYLSKTHWKGHESPYAGLIAYIGYKQAGRDAEAEEVLNEAAAHEPFQAWPQNIFRYLRHQISASQLLALASDNDEQADAHVYIGMDLALDGHIEALSHANWLRENENEELIEYSDLISEWTRATK